MQRRSRAIHHQHPHGRLLQRLVVVISFLLVSALGAPSEAMAAKPSAKLRHIDRKGMYWAISGGLTVCTNGYYPCSVKRELYSSISSPLVGASVALGYRLNPFFAVLVTYDYGSVGISNYDGDRYTNYGYFHSGTGSARMMLPFGVPELGFEAGLGWGHWSYGTGVGRSVSGMGLVGRLSPTLDFYVRPRLFVGAGFVAFLNGFNRNTCAEKSSNVDTCPSVQGNLSYNTVRDYDEFRQGLPHRNSIMVAFRLGGQFF